MFIWKCQWPLNCNFVATNYWLRVMFIKQVLCFCHFQVLEPQVPKLFLWGWSHFSLQLGADGIWWAAHQRSCQWTLLCLTAVPGSRPSLLPRKLVAHPPVLDGGPPLTGCPWLSQSQLPQFGTPPGFLLPSPPTPLPLSSTPSAMGSGESAKGREKSREARSTAFHPGTGELRTGREAT